MKIDSTKDYAIKRHQSPKVYSVTFGAFFMEKNCYQKHFYYSCLALAFNGNHHKIYFLLYPFLIFHLGLEADVISNSKHISPLVVHQDVFSWYRTFSSEKTQCNAMHYSQINGATFQYHPRTQQRYIKLTLCITST